MTSTSRIAALPRPAIERLLALAALTSASIVLFTSCQPSPSVAQTPPEEATVPVMVTSLAGSSSGAATITATGTLGGKEEVSLAFKIGGIIERINVDAGQTVRAGQVLATLRPTEIAAQVATAGEARAKAQRDLDRARRLYADSVATLQQLQDATTALNVAQQQERIARFNADYAIIRAATNGVVLQRLGEPGQVIEAGRSVLTVRSAAKGIVVRAGVADRLAVAVREGDSAQVRFDAMPARVFHGHVSRRSAAATPGTGSYELEVALGNDAASLPSGLVGTVTAWPSQSQRDASAAALLVPTDAIVDADGDSAAVFVVSADARTVRRVPVRLGDVGGALARGLVPVRTGLDGSERVVVAGTSRLLSGTRIRVVTAEGGRAK